MGLRQGGRVRLLFAAARSRRDDEGIIADGEIGDANPVYAVSTAVRREDPGAFTGIVLSTLPPAH